MIGLMLTNRLRYLVADVALVMLEVDCQEEWKAQAQDVRASGVSLSAMCVLFLLFPWLSGLMEYGLFAHDKGAIHHRRDGRCCTPHHTLNMDIHVNTSSPLTPWWTSYRYSHGWVSIQRISDTQAGVGHSWHGGEPHAKRRCESHSIQPLLALSSPPPPFALAVLSNHTRRVRLISGAAKPGVTGWSRKYRRTRPSASS